MIPQSTVDKILDTAKVEEVIGDFVTLKRQGASYLACCPFHNEKTPSFTVSPAKGFYYCFGCKKGGTAITFLMDHEKMSYVEALRYLANKYKIEIEEEELTPEAIAAKQRSESLHIVSEFAQKYFAEQLLSGEGRAVGLAYFKKRGLEEETIRKFGLGWCPSNSHAFHDAAFAAGYKEEYLIESGLCIKTEEGRVYDRFHERVVFPLHSASGRVLGFSCRTLKSDKTVAKYVNSPQTPIYDKSKFLYGIWFAKQEIARANECILVEGNLDMISLHQLGLTNVVASCGTSLTVDQIRLMKRFSENVTIIYDGDAAGIHAAIRGIGLVLKEGLNVRVVLLPNGMDPDDFSKGRTLEQVKQYFKDNARDFIGFKSELLLSESGDDPLKRAEVINDIADTIALIPDPVKRSVYADSCAKKLGIDAEILRQRISGTRSSIAKEDQRRAERETPPKTETIERPGMSGKRVVREVSLLEPVEKDLLGFLLKNGQELMQFPTDSEYFVDPPMTVAEFVSASFDDDGVHFESGVRRKAYEAYFKYYDEGLSQDEIIHKMASSEDQELVRLTVELTATRYEVTERTLAASMTKEQTILVQQVPRAILLYHSKRLESQIAEYKKQLSAPGADIRQILAEIARLSTMRNKINNKLGRI